MQVAIEVPDYEEEKVLRTEWEYGFRIEVKVSNGAVLLWADKGGLISLARHLLLLSQDAVPSGHHLHFDPGNALEDDSCELVISKI